MRQKFCGAAQTLTKAGKGGLGAPSGTVSFRPQQRPYPCLIETHGTRAMSRVALRCARQALQRWRMPCCALHRLYGGAEATKRGVFHYSGLAVGRPLNQTTVSRRCEHCKCPVAASRVSHFVCIARHTAHSTRPSARRSAYNPRHAYKRVTRTACLSHSTQSPAL